MKPLLLQPLSRRTLLRGMGSAALALPLLDAMQPRRAAAQSGAPRRIIFEFKPNGDQVSRRFVSTGEKDFELDEFLAPLQPYREELLFANRLNRPFLDLPRSERGDNHQCGGASLSPWIFGEGSFPVGGESRFIGPVLGPSADYVLGERVLEANPGVAYRHLAYRVGDRENNIWNMLSHAGPEGVSSPIAPETDPAQAYARLFGEVFASSDERQELERRLMSRRSMLDALVAENQGLVSRLGGDDRARIEQYTDALRDVERSLVLPTERQACVSTGPDPFTVLGNALDPSLHAEVGGLFQRIVALAFACDLSRVVNFAWSGSASNRVYKDLGQEEAHHDISHKNSDESFAQIRSIHRHLWQQSVGLYEALKNTPEGDGSLWDSTLIVHWNELGQGNVHSLQDALVVLAGGNSAFSGGRYLDFENRAFFGQMLVSAFHYLGFDDIDQFGDPRLSDPGPLGGVAGF